ncbi:MAG: heavy-metal-associated domain-containing protein [Rhodobiaceae bacterium]|nr:heavy-metal-associated domain-containing protein [Rhodobiaceae bacterium]MCC0048588.1 heavy-metal-associated domain-containing protein [Rhodobiaceae bacterium]
MKFSVPDMSCEHCKAAVESAVMAADPHADVSVDLDAKTVEIASSLKPGVFVDVLRSGGYEATQVAG